MPVHFVLVRGNNDAYDTNKMAEEFTHQFLDQAFSVGQQVQNALKLAKVVPLLF